MDILAIKSDVFKYLEKSGAKADVVFADPPYDFTDEQFKNIAELVFEHDVLNENGMLIIEHSKHTDISSGRNFNEARRYGNSVFSFFYVS